MKIIMCDKIEKIKKSTIQIVIENDNVNLNADDVCYEDMLKALETLTYATTKCGIKNVKCAMDIFNITRDVTSVMVEGRDNAFEENC